MNVSCFVLINIFRVAFCLLSKDVGNLKGLGCKNRINVSVLREAMKDALLVQKVLEGGFEVGWSGVDEDRCDGCIKLERKKGSKKMHCWGC